MADRQFSKGLSLNGKRQAAPSSKGHNSGKKFGGNFDGKGRKYPGGSNQFAGH